MLFNLNDTKSSQKQLNKNKIEIKIINNKTITSLIQSNKNEKNWSKVSILKSVKWTRYPLKAIVTSTITPLTIWFHHFGRFWFRIGFLIL